VPPPLGSIAAANMGINAQATTKGAIMFLTNFVFITVILSIVLAFLGFPPWEVISGRSLTYSAGFGDSLRGKMRTPDCADDTDATDGFLIGV
jgi:hypothetical protein